MAKKKLSLGVIGTTIVMSSYGVWKSQENKRVTAATVCCPASRVCSISVHLWRRLS